MRYVCFFLVFSSWSICTTCIKSRFESRYGQNGHFREKTWNFFLLVKKVFSKRLLFLDEICGGGIRFVCFFGVFSNYIGLYNLFAVWLERSFGINSKLVRKCKLLFVSKKSLLLKSSISQDVVDIRYVWFLGVLVVSRSVQSVGILIWA